MSAEATAHLVKLEHQYEQLKTELVEIKAMLTAQASKPPAAPGVSIAGVRALTGHRSDKAARRWLKANRVAPYAPGRWYANAVESAMARRSFAEVRALARPARMALAVAGGVS